MGSGGREGPGGPGRDLGRGGGRGRAQKCPPLPKLGLWGPAHRGQVHQVTRHTQPELWQKQTGHLVPTAPPRKRPQISRWRRSLRAPPRSPREGNGPEEPSWKPHPALAAPAAASLRPLLRLQVAARRAGEREPERRAVRTTPPPDPGPAAAAAASPQSFPPARRLRAQPGGTEPRPGLRHPDPREVSAPGWVG